MPFDTETLKFMQKHGIDRKRVACLDMTGDYLNLSLPDFMAKVNTFVAESGIAPEKFNVTYSHTSGYSGECEYEFSVEAIVDMTDDEVLADEIDEEVPGNGAEAFDREVAMSMKNEWGKSF